MIVELSSLDCADLAVYSQLTEAQLRNKVDPQQALFIAESPKVILTALGAGYQLVSLLTEARHLTGDAAPILQQLPADTPVYTGSRALLQQLTGYTLTRGVLAAMRRPEVTPHLAAHTGEHASLDTLLTHAHRVVVIDGVTDTTNIGAIFRAAAALGIDAALLTPTACDPLNRRAVRVSMGSVFLLPWTRFSAPLSALHRYGFVTAAMALTRESLTLDDPRLKTLPRLALVMGTEGDGLAPTVIAEADYVVRIPMHHTVDSLNVASAAAVAFWELRHT